MTEQSFPLPLGLRHEDLDHSEIKYGLYSSKSGAGVEEVAFAGNGRVVLRRTASFDAKPEVIEGAVLSWVFVRLLELFEDQRFFGLDEEPVPGPPGLRRIVTVTTPQGSKRVIVDNEGSIPFERCVSALLFAASLADERVPERRFFKLMGPL